MKYTRVITAAVVFVMLVMALTQAAREHRAWEAFKLTHHCQLVAREDGVSEREGWKCDDRSIHWHPSY
jgi:hypothetical protein